MAAKITLKPRLVRLRHSQSGQALVEVGVAGSLFALIILGVVEFGQVAYSSIEVSNAAKAGVQYGASMQGGNNTASDTTGIQAAASAAAPDLTVVTTTSYSCVCSDGTTSTCDISDCANSHIEETVTVNTQATITPIIKLPGFGSGFTLKGQAIQQCTQ